MPRLEKSKELISAQKNRWQFLIGYTLTFVGNRTTGHLWTKLLVVVGPAFTESGLVEVR